MGEFRAWYSASELAGMPGMPASDRYVALMAERDGWDRRWVETPIGHWEYSIASAKFPVATHKLLVDAWHAEERAAEEPADPFDALPRYERDRGLARAKVLRALDAFELARGGEDGREAFAAAYRARSLALPEYVYGRIKTLDAPTLTAWRTAEAEGGLFALAQGSKNRRAYHGKIEASPELERIVLAAVFRHPAVDAGTIHEYLRAEHPHLASSVSERTIDRFVMRWKATHPEQWTDLQSPDRWKSRFAASFGRAAEGIERLNQLWELDDTPADLLLVDGRHVVSGVIDVYSRRARLVVAKTSKAETVAAVFRRGLLDWGVPECVRVDNGQNFKSHHIATLLRKLEIDIVHCKPFASEQKPFIERFFRTFSHHLVEVLPGYIGHNVGERRDIEARKSFAQRIMTPGETIDVQMTAAELQAFCDRWCAAVYERNAHDGLDGQTPFEVASSWSEPVRRIQDARALDVLLAAAPGAGRTVRKKGIEVDGAWFVHPELVAWIGQRVEVRLDPTDLGRIYVFGAEHQFICVAEDPDRTGLDRREVAARAKRMQKERRASFRAEMRETKRTIKTDIASAILEMREREASQLVAGPRPTVAHETPALAGAADAVAAIAELAAPRVVKHDATKLQQGAESIARWTSKAAQQRQAELDDAAYDEACWQRASRLEASSLMTTEEREWLDGYRKTPSYRGRKHRELVARGRQQQFG